MGFRRGHSGQKTRVNRHIIYECCLHSGVQFQPIFRIIHAVPFSQWSRVSIFFLLLTVACLKKIKVSDFLKMIIFFWLVIKVGALRFYRWESYCVSFLKKK